MSFKFDYKTRYMTKGISSKIPLSLQLYIWNLIDDKINSKEKMDYLQIFEIKNNNKNLIVVHKQENPLYRKEYRLKIIEEYIGIENTKIYVIDDQSHSTMLFADEY